MFSFMRHKIKVPGQEILQNVHSYTPDLVSLQEKDSWWVFVVGEDKTGHHMSWLMDPAKRSWEAFTAKPDYIMWRKYLGQKTVAVPLVADAVEYVKRMRLNGQAMFPSARIKGELFNIKPEHFLELDEYHENGVVFERKQIDVLIPYTGFLEFQELQFVLKKDKEGKEVKEYLGTTVPAIKTESRIEHVQAWMYVGIPEFWNGMGPMIVPSNPTKARRIGKTPMDYYYNFSGKDYTNEKVAVPAILKNGHTDPKDNK